MTRPFITHCSQKKMRGILTDLNNGWTVKALSKKLGMSEGTISKYERIYNTFGIQAFAKVDERYIDGSATAAHNRRSKEG